MCKNIKEWTGNLLVLEKFKLEWTKLYTETNIITLSIIGDTRTT